MKRLLHAMHIAALLFSAATTISLGAGLAAAWAKGLLSRDKLVQMLAVAYGLDDGGAEAAPSPVDQEQPAYEDLVRARMMAGLNWDLREASVTKGLEDLRNLEKVLQTDQARYKQLKESFDSYLAELEGQHTDSALLEVQRTLEAIQPKQAKEQILKMIENDALQQVVTIVKAMPLDKRKKILGEFKTPEETEQLYKILRELGSGAPEVTLIRDTRERLQQL